MQNNVSVQRIRSLCFDNLIFESDALIRKKEPLGWSYLANKEFCSFYALFKESKTMKCAFKAPQNFLRWSHDVPIVLNVWNYIFSSASQWDCPLNSGLSALEQEYLCKIVYACKALNYVLSPKNTCQGNFLQNVFKGSLMMVDQDFPTYYRMNDDEHRIIRSGSFSNSQIHP